MTAPLWLLTGPTGAGVSTAVDALSRAGADCTDNLPLQLLGHVAALPRERPVVVTIDGRQGDHVLLAPPFIVSDDELDQLTERLAGAIDAAIADAGR